MNKEKPILFNGDMVLAILSGQKTQTRRVLKPQPEYIENSGRWKFPVPKKTIHKMAKGNTHVYTGSREFWHYLPDGSCPYGQVGDELWVRETHALYHDGMDSGEGVSRVFYRADYDDGKCPMSNLKWKPSIFMFREFSRIQLRITDVRVERLQDISEDDAQAEGSPFKMPHSHRVWFRQLWGSINGKKHAWKSNPWLWVVEFERVKKVKF
jgi:hypothetical protein